MTLDLILLCLCSRADGHRAAYMVLLLMETESHNLLTPRRLMLVVMRQNRGLADDNKFQPRSRGPLPQREAADSLSLLERAFRPEVHLRCI
jgi:hypothetical protein